MNRSLMSVEAWISRVSRSGWTWYAKYLSANDTYAKATVHQGGPYLGKALLRTAFPHLTRRADREQNPDLQLQVHVASHGLSQDVRLIWYNSRRLEKKRANGRDEARLTNWGGRDHPLVAENATGSIVVFAFHQTASSVDADCCEVWVASSADEEDELLRIAGPLDPGAGLVFVPAVAESLNESFADSPCALGEAEMQAEWRDELPSGEAILEMVLARRARSRQLGIDARLLARRACEYELFRSIETHVVLPRVREGFGSVEEFVGYANSVTNRRKSRGGKSLELQARKIFDEETLAYSWTKATEDKRTPDFVFPSIEHYHRPSWPAERLRMLAAKTTCKDRWRQVLNEAARIPKKHLLTLQEGVSVPQFREMKEEGILLVVPSGLHQKYPEVLRDELVSLENFIAEANGLIP